MKKIIIYGFDGSTYVRTVIMTCIEKGVDYELKGFEFGSAQHLDLHPFMKMPAAKIGGKMFYETLAITTLVDDLSGPRLTPNDPFTKAIMLKWISSGIDDLYSAFVSNLLADEVVSIESVNQISKILLLLNKEIQATENFLDGQHITLADMFLYPMLNFAALKVPDFSILTGELSGLRKWFSAMDEQGCVINSVPNPS